MEFGWPHRNAFVQPEIDKVLFQGLDRFPQRRSRLCSKPLDANTSAEAPKDTVISTLQTTLLKSPTSCHRRLVCTLLRLIPQPTSALIYEGALMPFLPLLQFMRRNSALRDAAAATEDLKVELRPRAEVLDHPSRCN
jgi:hypothetical protein